jgi:hypothetical protein
MRSLHTAPDAPAYCAAARLVGVGAPLRVPTALLRSGAARAQGAPEPPARGGGRGAGPASGRYSNELQAARERERDCLLVNGLRLPGAALGFTGVLAAIVAIIRGVEARAFGGSPRAAGGEEAALEAALLSRARAIALSLLRLANRTVSGGDGYEAASRLFSPSGEAPPEGGAGGGGGAMLSGDAGFLAALRAWGGVPEGWGEGGEGGRSGSMSRPREARSASSAPARSPSARRCVPRLWSSRASNLESSSTGALSAARPADMRKSSGRRFLMVRQSCGGWR